MILDICGRSDVGLVRPHNEDSFLFADLGSGVVSTPDEFRPLTITESPAVLMVADGVGGAASGELASSIATDSVFTTLRQWWQGDPETTRASIASALGEALDSANSEIHGKASGSPAHRGMGTTATLALILDGHVHLAQVGDSRGYLIRGSEVRQLTKDQSLVQRLIDSGRMTRSEAERSEHRNIILQALGPETNVVSDMYHEELEPGDRVLICSDGLSNQINERELAEISNGNPAPGELCAALINRALATGAPDNVTAIAVRVR